jgi:YggT family protein
MTNALYIVAQFVFQIAIFLFVLRFLMQACRVDAYNPIAQGVVKITDVLLKPVRAVLPGYANLDFASFLGAWLASVLKFYTLAAITGALVGGAPFVIAWGLLEVLMQVLFVFKWAIIIMIVASWIAPGSYHPALALVNQVVDPILAPVRRLIPGIGGLDLSPMLVILAVFVLESVLPELFSSLF